MSQADTPFARRLGPAGRFAHPARAIPLTFLVAIAIGTVLLLLPAARAEGGGAPFMTALFTATSAVCITGLVVVDTATYWSPFGQVVIFALFQIGGFGIMTGATLLGLLVSRRLRLTQRRIVQAETRSLTPADVRGVMLVVLSVTLVIEAAVTAVLALRLHFAYDEPWGIALWHGLFHAVSAFNNAGFSLYSDSLVRFALDPVVLIPVMLAVIVSGLGFPVIHELRQEWRTPGLWSIHAKITLFGTAILLPLGFAAIAVIEWNNGRTVGDLPGWGRALGALFHSVMTRSGGFNSFDTGALRSESLLVSDMLMFIGGGSAGTAGGIKITTFFLLGFVVWAEIRGHSDASAFNRGISAEVQRQALTIVLLATALVSLSTLALLSLTPFPLDRVLFEVLSAAATVGLSTGITDDLPPAGQIILIGLMFVGRVSTITLAAGLALRTRKRLYRFPEESPIVG
jgi:trk system potassium uptake protein TrkH